MRPIFRHFIAVVTVAATVHAATPATAQFTRLDVDLPTESDRFRQFLFFAAIALHAVMPRNNPELRGFGQNLDLANGWSASGGLGGVYPLPPTQTPGRFGLIYGIDGYWMSMEAKRVTNQAGGGVLQLSNSHYQSLGFIPYLGLAFLTRSNWWFAVKGGYGGAWNSVYLAAAAPIVDSREFGRVWKMEAQILAPLTPAIKAGVTVGYMETGDINARVISTGAPFVLSRVGTFSVAGNVYVLLGGRPERRVRSLSSP